LSLVEGDRLFWPADTRSLRDALLSGYIGEQKKIFADLSTPVDVYQAISGLGKDLAVESNGSRGRLCLCGNVVKAALYRHVRKGSSLLLTPFSCENIQVCGHFAVIASPSSKGSSQA